VNHPQTSCAFPGSECLYRDAIDHRLLSPECAGVCSADPIGEGAPHVLKVVSADAVAFRSDDPVRDPLRQCPNVGADVACDNSTNILDVIRYASMALRGVGSFSRSSILFLRCTIWD
jgi:hypothetical protein